MLYNANSMNPDTSWAIQLQQRDGCVSWMLAVGGEVLGRVGGQFQKQHTHPSEKNEDPHVCAVHTKLEQLKTLLKSPGNSINFVDDGQVHSVNSSETVLPPPQHRAL